MVGLQVGAPQGSSEANQSDGRLVSELRSDCSAATERGKEERQQAGPGRQCWG